MTLDQRILSTDLLGLIDRVGIDAARVAEAAGMDYADLHRLLVMRRDDTPTEVDALAAALGVEPTVLLTPR